MFFCKCLFPIALDDLAKIIAGFDVIFGLFLMIMTVVFINTFRKADCFSVIGTDVDSIVKLQCGTIVKLFVIFAIIWLIFMMHHCGAAIHLFYSVVADSTTRMLHYQLSVMLLIACEVTMMILLLIDRD